MTFVTVARKQDIAAGTVKVATLEGHRIALCHLQDGSFHAVEDRCTHDNAPLDQAALEGCQIECPRHGARFDVTSGAVTCLPAVKPIQTYPVRVQGDDVQVALEALHG